MKINDLAFICIFNAKLFYSNTYYILSNEELFVKRKRSEKGFPRLDTNVI